jgi:hypothetical protein
VDPVPGPLLLRISGRADDDNNDNNTDSLALNFDRSLVFENTGKTICSCNDVNKKTEIWKGTLQFPSETYFLCVTGCKGCMIRVHASEGQNTKCVV